MFVGFSDRTVDFLWGVRFNNNREWMAAHKQEYQNDLLIPLRELAEEVYTAMSTRYPEAQLCLHVARIYRDARRMHGNGPLKEDLWFSIFGGGERRIQCPEFYFDVSPDGYSFGLGIWSATPATMARFRRDVQANPKPLTSLAQTFAQQDRFLLQGENYSKAKGDVGMLLNPWYNKRKIYFNCERHYDDAVYSRKIVSELIDGYSFLMPYCSFFDALCKRED